MSSPRPVPYLFLHLQHGDVTHVVTWLADRLKHSSLAHYNELQLRKIYAYLVRNFRASLMADVLEEYETESDR